MVLMADVDQFLFDMQMRAFGCAPFAIYGDSAFRVIRRCIMGAHKAPRGGVLTSRQIIENAALSAVRQSIEWPFVLTSSLFQIYNNFNLVRLNSEHPYTVEQLRCSYLFTNCYTCLNQNVVSARNIFGCKAPTLEDYLIP